MTDTADATHDTINDPQAIVAALDALWRTNAPLPYSDGRQLQPLLGSRYDQKTVGLNPYWDIVRRLPLDTGMSWTSEIAVDGWRPMPAGELVVYRHMLTPAYAWAIPSPDDIGWITTLLDGRGVVEIGAGTGYWAWQLAQAGVDVAAYDAKPGGNHYCSPVQYHPVQEGGPRKASQHPDRALLLCWPPYDTAMATETLRAYTGDLLIYVGEYGGCNADDDFFELLDSDWQSLGGSTRHVTYAGIHCRLDAYQRSAQEAPSP